jgi:RNA polymerase sigma-70 factor (ECF subfamily)
MDESELRDRLESLHRQSFGWALSCCRRDPVEAENLLQEAYLKILDGRARYDSRSSFKTWLFAVIRKTAADQWRRRLLARLHLDRHAAALERQASLKNGGNDATARFDEEVYRIELQAMFGRALGELPRRQREVLYLVFYHDLSLREASEVMQVSVGSARQHYERGKKRLRQLLGKLLDTEPVDSDCEAARITKEATS